MREYSVYHFEFIILAIRRCMLVCYACKTQLPVMLETQLMGNANCYTLYLE